MTFSWEDTVLCHVLYEDLWVRMSKYMWSVGLELQILLITDPKAIFRYMYPIALRETSLMKVIRADDW